MFIYNIVLAITIVIIAFSYTTKERPHERKRNKTSSIYLHYPTNIRNSNFACCDVCKMEKKPRRKPVQSGEHEN